jgi:hypothetical protein
MNSVPSAYRMPLLRPRRVEGEDYENALRLWYAEFEKRLAYVVVNEMGTTSSHDSEQDSYYEDEDEDDEYEVEDEYDYVENPMKTLTYQLKMVSSEELDEHVTDDCCMCLEKPKKMDAVTANCQHSYCTSCYEKYNKRTCPLCRQPVNLLTKYTKK